MVLFFGDGDAVTIDVVLLLVLLVLLLLMMLLLMLRLVMGHLKTSLEGHDNINTKLSKHILKKVDKAICTINDQLSLFSSFCVQSEL